MRGCRKLVALPLILAAMGLAHSGSAQGQANALSEEANIRFGNATQRTVCEEPNADQSVEAALRLVCFRDRLGAREVVLRVAAREIPISGACGSVLDSRRKEGSPASTAAVGREPRWRSHGR